MQKDDFWRENHTSSMNTWRKKYFRNCHNNGISFYSHVAWEVNLKNSSISWNLPGVLHGQDTKVHFNRKFVSHRISLGIFLWSSEKTSATCPKVPDKASLTCWEVSSVRTHMCMCICAHLHFHCLCIPLCGFCLPRSAPLLFIISIFLVFNSEFFTQNSP